MQSRIKTALSAPESFDFVIVGAGSAGCLLANRLSENPANRVLLLEAGSHDRYVWFHIPVGYLFLIGNPRADWCWSTQSCAGLNGRALLYPRGKVLGGCSAINGMIYMRGQAEDYDSWAAQGLTGWGWHDVLPYFLRHEDHFLGEGPFHARGGEVRVERQRLNWAVLDTFRKAAAECGIPPIEDFNTGDNEGSSYFQVNQKRGLRWSTARGFLSGVRHRPNLVIRTGAHAERIMFEGTRACGIRYRLGGQSLDVAAKRRVILAAGAIASPKLLLQSGFGDGAQLQAMGIETRMHRPGIGANLQDHLQLRPIYKVSGVPTLNTDYASLWRRAKMALDFALFRTGPLTMAPSQLGVFARSSPAQSRANLEFHVQPLSLDKFGEGLHPFGAITASVCNVRPTSRGQVRLASPDPFAAPIIAPEYLSTFEDQQVAVQSLHLVRKIMAAPALAPLKPEEYRPGVHLRTQEALVQAAGDIGTTIFHPVGTVRMGQASDPYAGVDARLNVIGAQNLSVIDASVMPTIPSGNTNAPTLMIAEKGAEFVLNGEGA